MRSILLALVAVMVLALNVNDTNATGVRFGGVAVANVGGINVLVAPGISRSRAVVRNNVGLFGVRSRVVNVNRGARARVFSVNRGFGARVFNVNRGFGSNVVAINNAGALFAPSNVFVSRGFVGNNVISVNANPFASRAVLVNPSAAFAIRQNAFSVPAINSFQNFAVPNNVSVFNAGCSGSGVSRVRVRGRF